MSDQDIERMYCNDCGQETRHILRFKLETIRAEEEGGKQIPDFTIKNDDLYEESEDPDDIYEVFECLGCRSVVFQHTHWIPILSEPVVSCYPPRISRRVPRWKHKLPPHLQSLLGEVYTALQANSHRLALMGARAVVDLVILDKVGDVGTFREKLESLEEQGFVGQKNRGFLAAGLEAGSAAAHRGYVANPDHLEHVMDIVENLLEAVYILENAAETVRKSTPPRVTRKSASKQSKPNASPESEVSQRVLCLSFTSSAME
jgi:hypothetical protein